MSHAFCFLLPGRSECSSSAKRILKQAASIIHPGIVLIFSVYFFFFYPWTEFPFHTDIIMSASVQAVRHIPALFFFYYYHLLPSGAFYNFVSPSRTILSGLGWLKIRRHNRLLEEHNITPLAILCWFITDPCALPFPLIYTSMRVN